jgi:hypothetical protein
MTHISNKFIISIIFSRNSYNKSTEEGVVDIPYNNIYNLSLLSMSKFNTLPAFFFYHQYSNSHVH